MEYTTTVKHGAYHDYDAPIVEVKGDIAEEIGALLTSEGGVSEGTIEGVKSFLIWLNGSVSQIHKHLIGYIEDDDSESSPYTYKVGKVMNSDICYVAVWVTDNIKVKYYTQDVDSRVCIHIYEYDTLYRNESSHTVIRDNNRMTALLKFEAIMAQLLNIYGSKQ